MEKADSTEVQAQNTDHITIDIRYPDENFVNSIRRKMESISSSLSICMIKESLRNANKKAYIPEKVSVGPYHHGNENLKDMEDQKWRYVYALLSRKPNIEAILNDCVVALKELEQRAQTCYAERLNFKDNDFLQILLVDGCFIIELFLNYSIKSLRRRNDPIFSTPGMLYDLRCDMILLENQLPLFVLQRLFQLVPIPKQSTYSFAELAFRFFRNMIPGDHQVHREKFNQEGHHLLDLICHCLLPTYQRMQPKQPKSEKNLHCATELRRAGIRTKKARRENLLDISFSNGVLEIPPIRVHQYTENLLRNLIALEQCSSDNVQVQHITSYAVLMKSLICSVKDVELLQHKGILNNYNANEKEVAELFDRLCQEVDLKESYYGGLCEEVKGYKGTRLHALSKRLKNRYRENPMLRSVLLVTILVLFLTLIGTSFSVLSFSLRRHQ